MKPVYKNSVKILSAMYKSRGFCDFKIIANWSEIVGSHLSQFCYPDRITKVRSQQKNINKITPTLIIKSSPAIAVELQHLSQDIICNINRYVGFNHVGAVKIVQTYTPKITSDCSIDDLFGDEEKNIPLISEKVVYDKNINNVNNSKLQDSLKKLQRAMQNEK